MKYIYHYSAYTTSGDQLTTHGIHTTEEPIADNMAYEGLVQQVADLLKVSKSSVVIHSLSALGTLGDPEEQAQPVQELEVEPVWNTKGYPAPYTNVWILAANRQPVIGWMGLSCNFYTADKEEQIYNIIGWKHITLNNAS